MLPTPNNHERAGAVGNRYAWLYAHEGRSAAVDGGAGAFGSPTRIPWGYEKGNASWDIGIILTRHDLACARVIELRRTAIVRGQPDKRLRLALSVACTCHANDSKSERTSMTNKKEKTNNEFTTFRAPPI